jgi:hypothetical protein
LTGANTNILFQGPTSAGTVYYQNVGFFTITESGRLGVVDTDRVIGVTPASPSSPNQVLRQFTPAQLAAGQGRTFAATCNLVGIELKCVAQTLQNTFNTFYLSRAAASANIFSLATEALVASSNSVRAVSVGAFYGADCVV